MSTDPVGAGRSGPPGRNESPEQTADRNWNELLQELRVSQTGVQLLTGFLMVLPFQQQFADLSQGQRRGYLVALGLSVLAVGLFVAPVITHRLLFQRHHKVWLVRAGHLLALGGLAAAAGAIVTVIWLVVGLVMDQRAAVVAGAMATGFFAVVWVALPLAMRRRHQHP